MAQPPAPSWPAALLRTVAAVHAALVLLQAVLAGHFLSGDASALALHEANGTELVTSAALAQLVAAVLLWRPGRGPVWPLAASLALVVAEGFQIHAGFIGQLALHVPLGVTIFAASVLLLLAPYRFGRT